MTIPQVDSRFSAAFSRLAERIVRDLPDLTGDRQMLEAPHPVRASVLPDTHPQLICASLTGDISGNMLASLLRSRRSIPYILDALSDPSSPASPYLLHSAQLHSTVCTSLGGVGSGAFGALLQSIRYQICGGKMFTLDDQLVALLDKTDLGADVPVSELRLPFDDIYIQLGTRRDAANAVGFLRNPVTGNHILEGAYLSRTVEPDGSAGLEICLTGSPAGHSGLLSDDAVEWVSLVVSPGSSVGEALHNAFARPRVLARDERGALSVQTLQPTGAEAAARDAFANSMLPKLDLIAKALLYINLPSARSEFVNAGTEARKALVRAVSGAHRRKAARQAARSYDTILIRAPEALSSMAAPGGVDESGRTIATHWRRGHFRSQAHGPKLANRKTIWVPPVLVNAEQISAPVTQKRYSAGIRP